MSEKAFATRLKMSQSKLVLFAIGIRDVSLVVNACLQVPTAGSVNVVPTLWERFLLPELWGSARVIQ